MSCVFTEPQLVQCIPSSGDDRFENVAFSSSGRILGAANAGAGTVLLFRRKQDGLFEDKPYCSVDAPIPGLSYPHDISFAMYEDTELLAVTHRRGAIRFFQRDRANDYFDVNPAFEISGLKSTLGYSDGGAFVPPDHEYFAACNLKQGTVSFFRRTSQSSIRFGPAPEFVLNLGRGRHPDGLGFSQCGRWLASANHDNQSVDIFRRDDRKYSDGTLEYGPRPIVTLDDAQLHYPHSVAFSKTNHLLVTNAGANYISVFEPESHSGETRWHQKRMLIKKIAPDEIFWKHNSQNRTEGGPKGVAVYDNHLAVCSPTIGLHIYAFQESRSEADVGA
jgi:hypothetical protein